MVLLERCHTTWPGQTSLWDTVTLLHFYTIWYAHYIVKGLFSLTWQHSPTTQNTNLSPQLTELGGLQHVCISCDFWLWLALVCLLVGCLTSQQHASVSQGQICTDNFTCCHTDIEVADQTFYLTQSQNTDTGPTSPSTDPLMPGAWQGSHWNANF